MQGSVKVKGRKMLYLSLECLLFHTDDVNHDVFPCFTECIAGDKEWIICFSSSQVSELDGHRMVTCEAVQTL